MSVLSSSSGQAAIRSAVSKSVNITEDMVHINDIQSAVRNGVSVMEVTSSAVIYSIFYTVTAEGQDSSSIYDALKGQLFLAISNHSFGRYLREAADVYDVPALKYASVNNASLTVSDPVVVTSHSPAPSTAPTYAASATDDPWRTVVLGVLVGISVPLGMLVFGLGFMNNKIVGMYTVTAGVVFPAVILALVIGWSSDNNVASALSSFGFLGRPNWASNPFAYHPLLMVGGCFLSMVMLLLSRVIFPDEIYYCAASIFLYALIVGCLTIGIYAVVKAVHMAGNPSLTSLHSWLGVGCVISVVTSIVTRLAGCAAGMPAATTPESALCKGPVTLVVAQTCADLLMLGITCVTIVTGITMQMGQCSYVNINYGSDNNPASHYASIPTACKVSFGLGVSIIITAIIAATIVIYRRDWSIPNSA